jgi:hypothetical protein
MQFRTIVLLFLGSCFLALAAQAQTRQLGSVTNVQKVGCPSGFTAGSSCQHLTVHGCPDVQDVGVTTGTLSGKAGTIVMFGGGGGTRPTGGAFVTDYHNSGYTVVDTQWDGGGWDMNPTSPNILASACRGATLLNYLSSSSAAPFCAQGFSAGSSEVAYAMSWYGLDKKLNHVELLSGPVMSDLKAGCEVPDARAVTVIPTNGAPFTNAPQYVAQFITQVSTLTGLSCQPPLPTNATENTSWLEQSIVQPVTPKHAFTTTVSGWLCDNGLNNSAAQGALFYSTLGSNYSLTRIARCGGSEGVGSGTTPQGVSGQAAIEADMKLQCIKKK